MPKCPYCQNEMKKGVLEGDGRAALICVEENQKRSLLSNMFNINKDCIVLSKITGFYRI